MERLKILIEYYIEQEKDVGIEDGTFACNVSLGCTHAYNHVLEMIEYLESEGQEK